MTTNVTLAKKYLKIVSAPPLKTKKKWATGNWLRKLKKGPG